MTKGKPQDLLERTFSFARDVLRICSQLPKGAEVGTIKRQLLRSGTSVGCFSAPIMVGPFYRPALMDGDLGNTPTNEEARTSD